MRYLILITASTLILGCAPKNVQRIEGASATNPDTIRVRVETALRNAPNVHANEIQIDVSGQVVTLRGEVHGQPEIDAAVAAARSVPGVQDVKSELKPTREP